MNFAHLNQDAFTGLEAAIVLIAFIIVAAVFGFVILGAGFFTTSKAQETVHSGVSQATAAVQQSGATSIQADATGFGVKQITFNLQLAASGTGAEMSAFGYTVSTPKKSITYSANDVTYSWLKEVTPSNHGAHAGVLAPKEMVMVTINSEWSTADMTLNDKITIEAKPAVGASVYIAGTVPGAMSGNNWYEVY
jgi:flagellin FlaB